MARAVAGVIASALLTIIAPAAYATVDQTQDQADNSFSFRFRHGEIRNAASSILTQKGDRVQFTVTVKDLRGNRLQGLIMLNLIRSEEPVRYSGTFSYVVTKPRSGEVVFTSDEPASLTLSKSHDAEKIPFALTLPDGRYNVTATFSN